MTIDRTPNNGAAAPPQSLSLSRSPSQALTIGSVAHSKRRGARARGKGNCTIILILCNRFSCRVLPLGGFHRHTAMPPENDPTVSKRLTYDQLDGCACVVWGSNQRPMLPLGLETSISSEVFRCDRDECAVDPAEVQRNRLTGPSTLRLLSRVGWEA